MSSLEHATEEVIWHLVRTEPAYVPPLGDHPMHRGPFGLVEPPASWIGGALRGPGGIKAGRRRGPGEPVGSSHGSSVDGQPGAAGARRDRVASVSAAARGTR